MTLPALVTTGILTFIFAWNEFIFALTFITREELQTIPVAVAKIGGSSAFEIPYGPIAAATVAGTFPLVINDCRTRSTQSGSSVYGWPGCDHSFPR